MSQASLLVINPNSSQSITDGLVKTLQSRAPLAARLVRPPSINDITTGNLSASACWRDIQEKGYLELYDGFLVCCFSDHPLIHILRENTRKSVVGIMESAIAQALLVAHRFGVLTTGTGYKYDRWKEIDAFLGARSSRFAGVVTSELGVIELREGDQTKIETNIKAAAAKLATLGADAILLGCKPLSIPLVQQGFAEVNSSMPAVRVIDGAKAGVEFLAALVRINKE
ncbi:hypothetical protein FISHEDRAFT_65696 [Fistulina hepatica ATCC 64428]|uniref:Asp/Glu/hydantoin racemase n=1 Tax=Fistulina hepatica ATCC 64428 TaxID=1128425 RepID=A0A0D7ADU8_9AGAR|nr:hypothetical protein FISHEDRAFT_65696 [Fistulina hepatica ATCC 64428]